MKYHEQIKHPLWQKKRLEVLEANNFTCQECGGTETTLNVHHPFYKRGAMIWDYEINELKCLCEPCHKEEHELDEKLKQSCVLLTKRDKWKTLGYVESKVMQMELDENNIDGKLVYKNPDHTEGVSDSFYNLDNDILQHLWQDGNVELLISDVDLEALHWNKRLVSKGVYNND
jgi:hypothetical protein